MTATIDGSSAGTGTKAAVPERPAGGEAMYGRNAERRVVRDLLRRARRGQAACCWSTASRE